MVTLEIKGNLLCIDINKNSHHPNLSVARMDSQGELEIIEKFLKTIKEKTTLTKEYLKTSLIAAVDPQRKDLNYQNTVKSYIEEACK